MTLKSLFEDYPTVLLGAEHARKYGANTQVLLKLLDFALSMFSYEAKPIDALRKRFLGQSKTLERQNQSTESALVDEEKTACFRVNRIDVQDCFVKESDSFYVGNISRASGTIAIGGETRAVSEGERFLVPGSVRDGRCRFRIRNRNGNHYYVST